MSPSRQSQEDRCSLFHLFIFQRLANRYVLQAYRAQVSIRTTLLCQDRVKAIIVCSQWGRLPLSMGLTCQVSLFLSQMQVCPRGIICRATLRKNKKQKNWSNPVSCFHLTWCLYKHSEAHSQMSLVDVPQVNSRSAQGVKDDPVHILEPLSLGHAHIMFSYLLL